MTGRFAEGTTVPPERSQMEITALLRRYQADGFAFGWEGDKATIMFRAHDRTVRMLVPLPSEDDPEFKRTPSGKQTRNAAGVKAAHEAEVRRRWRCLALAIKAKLEAVDTGIATFEDEFLAYVVLPNGGTVGEQIQSGLTNVLQGVGPMPLLLGGGS